MANKKKQKLSFAQRAERIMKKYEARPDDTAAQDSKNRELGVLQEEQKLEMQNRAMEAAETMKSLGYGHMLASDEPQQGPPQPSQEEMMAMQQQGPMHQMPDGSMMPGEQHGQQMAAYGGRIKKYAPGGEFEAESVNPWIAAGQLAPDVYGLAQNLRPGDDFTSKKMDSNIYTDTSAEEAAIDRATGSAGAGLRENLRRLGSAGAKSAAVTGATQIATGAGAQKAGVISQAQQLDDKTNLGIEAQNNALINADAQFNMQQKGDQRTDTEQYLRNIGQETVPGIALDQTQNEMQAAIIKALGSGDYAYEGGIEDLILAFQGGQAKKGE